MTLREELAAGRIKREDLVGTGDGKAPGTVNPALLPQSSIVGVPLQPKIRTPEEQARLDAKFGNVSGVKMAQPMGDFIPPQTTYLNQPEMGPIPQSLPTSIGGVEIEYGFQIPDPKSRYETVIGQLPVGASVGIPLVELKKNQIVYMLKKICKGNEKKFTCHPYTHGGVLENRVWRTA